ncbi:MAG: hypothetical protein HYY00_06615 [Chloroflexi bacterium]|nr:hypothetical protein [Chloroflexota bacterium]
MTTRTQRLNPADIIAQWKKNGVTHVVWLPDSESNFMYQAMMADKSFDLVSVCREGESMAVAAGLMLGGKKPVVLIQNTGLMESGDSVRGLVLDLDLPLVMMIGYRGWTGHRVTTDSAARYLEPILTAWHINHYVIESNRDVSLISNAFEEAERTHRAVAVLVGKEYD